jgi:hypothetical protein
VLDQLVYLLTEIIFLHSILYDSSGPRNEKNVILADFGLGKDVAATLAQTFCGVRLFCVPLVLMKC